MSHLVMFDHLIPFEAAIDKADEKTRLRYFNVYYYFGSKIYECLHAIAIEAEQETDGFPTKALTTVLKMFKFENFIASDDSHFPPVSDILNAIENQQVKDTQILFKISDLLDDVKGETPDAYPPYDPTDPKRVPVSLAADAITSIGQMAYHFLATSFAEHIMESSIPVIDYFDDFPDDYSDCDHDGEEPCPHHDDEKEEEEVTHYRNLPQLDLNILRQNVQLLLGTRLGIVQFLELSWKVGRTSFLGEKLQKYSPLMEACAASNDLAIRRLIKLKVNTNHLSIPDCNTPLIYASATDGRDSVRELLIGKSPYKLDVYKINNNYHDAMMEAALVGGSETIQEFLDRGYRPRFIHVPENSTRTFTTRKLGESALTLASSKGHLEVVMTIMDFHEKNPPKTEDEMKDFFVDMYSALREASLFGHAEVCKFLLERGTPTDLRTAIPVFSPLFLSCSGGFADVAEILLAAGARIEEPNDEGYTPLMEAASAGTIEVIRVLIKWQVNINAINEENGVTAIALAAGEGAIEIMKLLMDKGGDLTAGGENCALVEAADKGQLESVQFILAHCKTVPQEQLSRALVAAAEKGALLIVEELVRAGADLNFEEEERTALMMAAKEDHFEIVQFLIDKGASINFKSSKNDATALSMACSEGNQEIAQYLIRNGADPMLKMDDGVNCFMEVARHGSCDLMSMLVEFTKGNMPLDKEPPKLGLGRRGAHKGKKKKGVPVSEMQSTEVMMMLQGVYPKKKAGKPHTEMPYSPLEIDMLTHMLKLQQQMVSYETGREEHEPKEIGQALEALESVYGRSPDGKINFPPPPNRRDMDLLYSGQLCPNIKYWAELVAHGWMEMERNIGKPIELSSFSHCSEGHSTNAAAAVSAVAAAATGMDSHTYLASVFAKMNNGEEMPRVPATVGSLNAASAAMTGISFHSDDAMRLFGGAAFPAKLSSDNKKMCSHQQYASVHHIQEGAFRAALLKMSASHQERKGAAVSVTGMTSTFPIETVRTRQFQAPREPRDQSETPKKYTSMTVVRKKKNDEDEVTVSMEVTTEQPGASKKVSIPPSKAYPAILQLASDMERMYRSNPTEANRERALMTAFIASTLPDECSAEGTGFESGDRILKKLLTGMSEKQKAAILARTRQAAINESGSEILRRSLDFLTDQQLKTDYLKLFRDTVDCDFYDQCVHERSQQLKSAEPTKKTTVVNSLKSMTKGGGGSNSQQGQVRRTHSEGDGAERAKARSNAIDKATETTQETPLTIACANGHKEIVELLLKEGANIEHRDKKGFSPLIIAATAGHSAVVEILLKNHAAIEAQSDRTKDTALSLACSGGRKEVVELLLAHGANKEHRNVSDYTPLSLASSGGFIDIVNMLLNAGSEINSRTGSKLGISPLMLASMNGHREATRVLLEKGSDINAQIETNRNTALTLASFQGRTEVVKLLLAYNANVEHRAKTGLTPLMECASGGYVDVGNLLIEAGADTNALSQSNNAKETALTISAEKGHEKFVRMLLNNEALIDTKNKRGCTPLWLACNGGHTSTVRALIEKGADPDAFSGQRVSPLMAAFKKGNLEIVSCLVKHAKQFPNEQDLVRAQQAAESEDIRDKCEQCKKVIRDATQTQAHSAEKAAKMLLELIDNEKEMNQKKKEKQKEKKKIKKEAKKQKEKPEPEPEPEPEPPKIETPPPPPAPPTPPIETPKDPPKPRRNRKKTNPDGIPKIKEVKIIAEELIEEPQNHPEHHEKQEEEEMPYKPIVVTIPPPAQIHAPLVSPTTSYSETADDWCKAGKEGKRVRKSAPMSSGASSQAAKESSTTSSVTSDNAAHPYEVDTKQRKHWTLTVHGLAMSRIIGKSGSNVNEIRKATSAIIEIEKMGEKKESERKVQVRGPPDAVRQAVSMIQLMLSDSEIAVQDAIRIVQNTSVASSISSEGTSKSGAHEPCSIPPSIPSTSGSRFQSASPAPSSHRASSKTGGNVWTQRLAARQEKVVESAPEPAPAPAPAPIRQFRPVEPIVQQAPAPVPAPVVAPIVAPSPVRHQAFPSPIAPPSKQAIVPPQPKPEPAPPSPFHTEPISRLPDPISRPAQFSKAPGTRPDFSRAPGPPAPAPPASSTRNELFDDSFSPFFKPIAPPTTTTFSSLNDEKNGNEEEFDFGKFRMFDDSKVADIWGKSSSSAEEPSSWGGLFSQFLTPSSVKKETIPTTTTAQSQDWRPSEVPYYSKPPVSSSTASSTPFSTLGSLSSSSQQQPTSSGLSSLELKGWMPTSTATYRSERHQPPLFGSRSPPNSSSSTTLQQQQHAQLQQLQQQQRLQQLQQQYQPSTSQSTINDVLAPKYSLIQQQQQQLYQLQQSLAGQEAGNMYNQRLQLAAQLAAHQENSSGSSSTQPNALSAGSYYNSPSYTDSNVLGQLNMQQRGIKQFDGFNNDSSSSDSVLAALLEQQKKNMASSQAAAGYAHSPSQPPPFAATPNQPSALRGLGPQLARPTQFPAPPHVPPGFSSLGASGASSQGSTSRLPPSMFGAQYGAQQGSGQMPFATLQQQQQQMEWNRMNQQQHPSQQPPPPSQSSGKWTNW